MCSFSPSNVNIRNTFRKNWNIFWMGGFVKWLSTHLTWKKIKFVFLLVFFKSSVLNVLCQDETIDMDCKKMRRCYNSLRTLFLLVPSSNGFILTGNFYYRHGSFQPIEHESLGSFDWEIMIHDHTFHESWIQQKQDVNGQWKVWLSN